MRPEVINPEARPEASKPAREGAEPAWSREESQPAASPGEGSSANPDEPTAASQPTESSAPPRPEATSELGRIERPAADQYQGKRRLLLLPLLYGPPPAADYGDTAQGEPKEGGSEEGGSAPAGAESPEAAGQAILERYWEQSSIQVKALSAGLGGLRRIYHESLTEGGAAGLAHLQLASVHSHRLVQDLLGAGAVLEAVESLDLLTETLDLQRCLLAPLTNSGVASRLQEWFMESNRRRYDHIVERIDQTLQADETGLLLINERHQAQFPGDLEVFHIAPPALDEFRRWLQNWTERGRGGSPSTTTLTPDGPE